MATKKKTPKKSMPKIPAKKKTPSTKKKSPKKKKSAKKLVTHIAIVLDKSGSMDSIREETISYFNEQVKKIKSEADKLDTKVSLVEFNQYVETKFFDADCSKLKELYLYDYVPNGYTAMYDAVGLTIDRMEKEISDINHKDVAALVLILSDGEENSSREYNSQDIADRIARLQKTGRWTFTYAGANQDLSKVSQQLHIPKGNMFAFVADHDGMGVAVAAASAGLGTYLGTRGLGITNSTNYYSGDSSDAIVGVDGNPIDTDQDKNN